MAAVALVAIGLAGVGLFREYQARAEREPCRGLQARGVLRHGQVGGVRRHGNTGRRIQRSARREPAAAIPSVLPQYMPHGAPPVRAAVNAERRVETRRPVVKHAVVDYFSVQYTSYWPFSVIAWSMPFL